MIGAALVALLIVTAQAAPAPRAECSSGQFRQLDGGCGGQMPQMPMPMQMPHFNPMMGHPMMPGFGMWPGYGGYMGGPYMPHSGGMHFGMPFGMPPMAGESVQPMHPMPQENGAFGQMPPGYTMESYDMSYFYPKKENNEVPTPTLTTTEAPKTKIEEAPEVPELSKLPQPPLKPQSNPKPVKNPKPAKDPQPANRPNLMVKDPPANQHWVQKPSFGPNLPNLQGLLQMMNSPQQPHKQQRPPKHNKPGNFNKKPEPVPEVEAEESELPPFKYITDFSEEDLSIVDKKKTPKQSLQPPPVSAAPSPVVACPAVDDRYRPVHIKHENCRMFYKCTNGQAIAQECPPHLMWSEAADRCVVMQGGQC